MDARRVTSGAREHRAEALVGLVVVLVALAFVLFAWSRTGGGRGGMEVTALFPSANGIAVGTDVRVAGLRVGAVSAQRLDPESLQAEVTLSLQEDLRIPADSSAAVANESLLGGSYIQLIPGGAAEPMKGGDVILETQGAVDMMGLIGGVINGTGRGAPPPAADMPTAETPAAETPVTDAPSAETPASEAPPAS